MKLYHKYEEGGLYQLGINFTKEHINSIFIFILVIPFFIPIYKKYRSFDFAGICHGYRVPCLALRIRLRTKKFTKRLLINSAISWKNFGKQENYAYDFDELERRWLTRQI